jgi:nucleotide-binding universal stress UspA family protein
MTKLENILVPTDLDENSNHALAYGRELAATYGATLHLFHVVESIWSGSLTVADFPGQMDNYYQQYRQASETGLKNMAKKIKEVEVKTALIEGTPHTEIVRYAREHKIDLIVLATHGRTGLSHMLIGSVAEKVVQMAPCPVITIKHPEHEFVLP